MADKKKVWHPINYRVVLTFVLEFLVFVVLTSVAAKVSLLIFESKLIVGG